jgi:hypothetical protein
MKSFVILVAAVCLVAGLVWFRVTRIKLPPNARVLCDLWKWADSEKRR